ncbi:Gfo/Idh/MocA family protein [Microbacterium gubbeenense]|uniref:Gfo/Idh/MocA family protein n=1 Tax=Microbacterium gubbeenense TaxID=159896 RepID=UPI003F9C6126
MTLRWGILATGGIARKFTSDLITAGLTVAAAGSRTQESADRFAGEFGILAAHGSYAALAEDPGVDAIYIATPHPQHVEAARLALAGGKHVLIEKPITLTGFEAAEIRDLAEARGLVAMEAMWTRYVPMMARIREILAAGTIGEVRTVSADHTQSISTDPAHRLNALELGGGALLDLGIYPISFVWDVLGAPATIQASGRIGETGADTEVATVMTHASGAVSTTMSSSRGAGPNTAHIVGSRARIDIDRTWYNQTTFTVTSSDGSVIERYEEAIDGRGMQFQALALENAVATGVAPLLSIDESTEIMRTLDEIRRQIGVRYPGE